MNQLGSLTTQSEALSVSVYIDKLNRTLKSQAYRIKGEVTTVKSFNWGVIYTVKDKDDNACLDCMTWDRDYRANGVELKVGDEIIITGHPDVYKPNGRLSFKASVIEYAGEGALKRDYEKLKAKLTAEGIFNREHKRALPTLPTKIGVITSMNGVVIQDFTTNLSLHGFKIKTVDSRVEGKEALNELLEAIKTMSKQDIEVLVIMRGGGSLEALQAFNNEMLVRSIANFKVPVLTGIGHDVDVTLSEMAADVGRSTPTAVAEALNEQWDGLIHQLEVLQGKILGSYRTSLIVSSQEVVAKSHNVFRRYERRLAQARSDLNDKSGIVKTRYASLANRVREAALVLTTATSIMKSAIRVKRRSLAQIPSDLRRLTQTAKTATNQRMSVIFEQITSYQSDAIVTSRLSMSDNFDQIAQKQALGIKVNQQTISSASQGILRAQHSAVQNAKRTLPSLEKQITAHDPKRRLKQGYSLSFVNGKLLRGVADIAIGETVTTQLADGEFTSLIKEVQ